MTTRRPIRALIRLLRWAVGLWGTSFCAVCLWTFLWPLDGPLPEADVIICLGAGIDANGDLGPGSRARAETCRALHAAGAAPIVVFTGGRPAGGPISAAAAMAQESGLPDAAVVLEEHSFSTLQNALFTRDHHGPGTHAVLVSEAFHLPRTWISFRAMGAGDLSLYPAGRVRRTADGTGPNMRLLLRESVALWFNAGRYLLWRGAGLVGVSEDRRTDLLH